MNYVDGFLLAVPTDKRDALAVDEVHGAAPLLHARIMVFGGFVPLIDKSS
jgi:uncharacterized protein YbaA (DUF1428 family)